MQTLLSLILFGAVSTATFAVAQAATLPARERRKALARAVERREEREGTAPAFRVRVAAPLAARLARLVLRVSPGTTLDTVALKLLAAGKRDVSPTSFLALKGLAGLGGLLLGLLVGARTGAFAAVAFAVAAAAFGYVAPDYVLSRRARRRRERIRADLPDALDLLAVSVEAGLGFDGAVAKLADHLEGPLMEEFALMLGEMRIGQSRQEALRKLSERVDTAELTAFTRSVIQADRLGISLGGILRVQADEARFRRQNAAEETAMKAPVKMLFPTVLFIFPAMFVVVLGPALLNFSKVF